MRQKTKINEGLRSKRGIDDTTSKNFPPLKYWAHGDNIGHAVDLVGAKMFNISKMQIYLNDLSLTMSEVKMNWLNGRISPHLFDLLGRERLCDVNSICDSAKHISCVIDTSAQEATFSFLAPNYDRNIELFKAIPIKIVKQVKTRYCLLEYVGIDYMYYNNVLGCGSLATISDTTHDSFVTGDECHRSLKTVDKRFWGVKTCRRNIEEARKLADPYVGFESGESFVYYFLRNSTIWRKNSGSNGSVATTREHLFLSLSMM